MVTRRDFLKLVGSTGLILAFEEKLNFLNYNLGDHEFDYKKSLYGSENINRILEEVGNGKKYTFIGENHWDGSLAELMLPLIDSGKFSKIYLEALKRGSYNERGNSLKGKKNVYGHDPKKYDKIIDGSLIKGLEVHGIDSHHKRENDYDETYKWAEYIIETSEDSSNLTLVGNGHLCYSHKFFTSGDLHFILPAHLMAQGVSSDEILIITSHGSREVLHGLYRFNELPETKIPKDSYYSEGNKISDYVWVRKPAPLDSPLLFPLKINYNYPA